MRNKRKHCVHKKKEKLNISKIVPYIYREYNSMYKVQIFVENINTNNLIPLNSHLTFNVCEKTTVLSLLKFCFDIVRPCETNPENLKVKILWKFEDNMDFDTFWSYDFKNTMTLEMLDYYYDSIYTKNNFIFLQIL